MKQRLLLLPILLSLPLCTGMAIRATHRAVAYGSVYSMADLRERLAAQPASWVGRIVVVRAIAEPCPWWDESACLQHCASRPLMLFGAPAEAPTDPLPLVRAAPQPLWSFLHGLPVIGDLLPRSSTVPLLVPARFRVRLLAPPIRACTGCYEALLLDASL